MYDIPVCNIEYTELQFDLNAFEAHQWPPSLAGTFQQAARLLRIPIVSIVAATLASSRGLLLLGLHTRRPVWALDYRERIRLGSAAGFDTRRDPFNHVLRIEARKYAALNVRCYPAAPSHLESVAEREERRRFLVAECLADTLGIQRNSRHARLIRVCERARVVAMLVPHEAPILQGGVDGLVEEVMLVRVALLRFAHRLLLDLERELPIAMRVDLDCAVKHRGCGMVS